MDYLPLSFDLKQKNVLLIGAGVVALRKAKALMSVHAIIHVIAPEMDDSFKTEFNEALASQKMFWLKKKFEKKDFEQFIRIVLVICASDDLEVNKQASHLAQEKNIPVNVVDNPSISTVIFPAIVDRDPITIAISTGGQAPVLARLLRTKIETSIPAAYGELAKLVDSFRDEVKALLPNFDQRKGFWEVVINSAAGELSFSSRLEKAKVHIVELIEQIRQQPSEEKRVYPGEVYLVGAGPGDPDLLSFKALRLLQQADVVLYDRLVTDEIVDLSRRDAERIYVGKSQKHHAVPQEKINELLVRLALEGKRVCRLKGGDPFIFGRGGEEIEELTEHNILFQVVPGVTAASGCSSYAGIPLTHRDYSQSVTFVTGHRKKDPKAELNWQSLAEGDQTLVFYMGLSEIQTIADNLMRYGMPASKPAALIQQGTTINQKVVSGELQDLPRLVIEQQVRAPTIIIVGDVVLLREKLSWFEPLASS